MGGEGGTGGAGGGPVVPWWDNAYARRVRIEINHTGNEVLEEFPLMVRISAQAISSLGQVREDGRDLRFVVEGQQAALPYEIEQWDDDLDSDESAVLWVRVPRIEPGQSRIWLYYGNDSAANVQAPPEVWAGFLGVYHFKEDNELRDSRGVYNALENGGPTTTNGPMARAMSFNGTNQHLILENINGISAFQGATRTIEAWFQTNATGVITLINQENACRGWALELRDAPAGVTGTFTAAANGCGPGQKTPYELHSTGVSPGMVRDNQWHYATLVIDRNAGFMRLYVDGVLRNERTGINQGLNAEAQTGWIGAAFGPVDRFNGQLDEIRIANAARSAGWILAQYRSMRAQMATLSGPVEQRPAP
ncbi:uncharacterized protein CMC5_050690 [Chondromyces crocatus]|uniref:LamG-like jellyroll fold domain-containing protein n=1 Tax=Chondromyces crocatus TaxID=52 RepID=A0A0K1EJP4_CHOCO|nr:uncharacterized protein CMC5_050690 [Chondromyces crocatus]